LVAVKRKGHKRYTGRQKEKNKGKRGNIALKYDYSTFTDKVKFSAFYNNFIPWK